jgi:hypothetical protein
MDLEETEVKNDSAGEGSSEAGSPRRRKAETIAPCERVGGCRDLHCFKPLRSNAELVVRQPPTRKDVNTEAEESTAVKVITKQPVETAHTEKTWCVLQ